MASSTGAGGGFELIVLDAQGHVSTWHAQASSDTHARTLAAQQGFSVLHCSARGTRGARAHWLPWRANAAFDVIGFAQDLATLLEAGVTVKEALDTLARRARVAAERSVLQQLNLSVAEGLRLSAALEQALVFPPLLVATVRASEQTGDVAVGLSRYARHQHGLRLLTDKVVGACVYPLLLVVVGFLVVALLLGVVVPRFAQVIDLQGRDLPLLSRYLMAWGSFVGNHPSVLALLLALFVGGLVWAIAQWRNPLRRRRWLEAIPGAAKVAREFQHLQMYRTTAILTARGIPVQNAMAYSADYLSAAGQARLQAGLLAMREGQALSAALAGSGLADEVAASMLAVAERSGALSEMLDRIADFYERSLQRNIDIASRLIEPVLMIIFGVLIGGLVLLMYMPIFDLASSVS